MSLTLNPLGAQSVFRDPSINLRHLELESRLSRPFADMESGRVDRVSSLDNLHHHPDPQTSSLIGRWLETCPPLRTPAARVIMESTALGTTFPPRAAINHPYRERMREIGECGTAHSEPDLTPFFNHFSDEESEGEEDRRRVEEDDQLFEFDMSPDRDIPDFDGEGELDSASPPPPTERHRAFSITSDSSGGSCSHRKMPPPEPEVSGGFNNIFGSISSGLGSDRRSVQECSDDPETEYDECKSFEPSQWRDYMNERLAANGDNAAAADLPPEAAGTATPILAAAGPNAPAGGAGSPLISPDSLLDGQHLNDNLAAFCPECESTVSPRTASPLPTTTTDSSPIVTHGPAVHTSTPIASTSAVAAMPINPILSPATSRKSEGGCVLREEELVKMLGRLEEDRGYPGVKVNRSSLDTSQDTEDEERSQMSGASTVDLLQLLNTSGSSDTSSCTEEGREEYSVPKLRKCSSLKSGRTPPGTPAPRKIVRFADIFGLDLSEIKTFTDEIPKIPKCAFQDLDVDISEYDFGSPRPQTPIQSFFKSQSKTQVPVSSSTSLVPMFTQPGCSSAFYETVTTRRVCLENAFMETSFTMGGIVRVSNLSFHKSVTVRWTVNDWNTSADASATYVDNSSDGATDKFKFRVSVGCLPVGSRVQFCLRYACGGQEFWDNNGGTNYIFQVFLSSNSPSSSHRVLSPNATSPNSASSAPVNIRRSNFTSAYGRGGGAFGGSSSFHQSPSIHADDPWMRFM